MQQCSGVELCGLSSVLIVANYDAYEVAMPTVARLSQPVLALQMFVLICKRVLIQVAVSHACIQVTSQNLVCSSCGTRPVHICQV